MVADLSTDTPDLRLQFHIFHELMSFKVREILLVSSPYDAFIMEEDTSIDTRIIQEYRELNLSGAPRITKVSTVAEAVREVSEKEIDLVFTMPYLLGTDAADLGFELKKIKPDLPVIMIGSNLRAMSFLPEHGSSRDIDNSFLWCCEVDLLVAIIKSVEDRINVDVDTERAMVRVILYVEDSSVHRSFFLPIMYRELVAQTQAVLDDSLSEKHRLLRMRARPKILTADNYEDAVSLYEKYKPYVYSIITDTRFARNGKIDEQAGYHLLKKVRQEFPDMPALLLSEDNRNKVLADQLPAVFINKNSPVVKDEFHNFFLEQIGFGDFVFRLPDGQEVGTASSLYEFEKKLRTLPDESLIYHLRRNHFSNWIMARSEVALAKRLHRNTVGDIDDVADMRNYLISKVNDLRKLRQRNVIVRFSRNSYDPQIMDFVRIGEGSIGGKARGIAFMWTRLNQAAQEGDVDFTVPVIIPKTCVITAEGFEDFIRINSLTFEQSQTDEQITRMFLAAKLPDWLEQDLRFFLKAFVWPLTVRSSSLLEDAQYKPFAGLYATYFLPNNHPDFEVRFGQLKEAIKHVYSSTWFEDPRAYSKLSSPMRNDSMAIILQQVVGTNFNGYLYPAVSGVAQSYNYYPVLHMSKEDGIAHIATGLGKTVVEGEKSLRFSPKYPKKLIQFSSVEEILSNTQYSFYALDMNNSDTFDPEMSNLVKRDIQQCADEIVIRQLSSTYIGDEYRIRDSQLPGHKVMTFARILKYDEYPLPKVLAELLRLGREGMGCEVEIEFALDMGLDGEIGSFYFLQVRPIVVGHELTHIWITDNERKSGFCYSDTSLGHGLFTSLADIVFVKPDVFNPAATKEMAKEIGLINRRLEKQKRGFCLIGPGRWGSADPWLGIPVTWSDISGVGAIIETSHKLLTADPSQGTHFFQNITSLGIPYVTVGLSEPANKKTDRESIKPFIDYDWLFKQPIRDDYVYVRHVRLEKPFILKCNGKQSEAVFAAV